MKWIIQFVLKQFAKRSAQKTGVAKLLKETDDIVQLNVRNIENTLKGMGINPKNLTSTDDVLNAMNYHKAMMDQRLKKQFGTLDLGKGIKSLEKKDPFQGFTPKIVPKDKTLLKDSPERIAKIKAENKAAAERLRAKKKIDVSKYTDDDLNALVREDIDLITEANKLSEAGTNYGRVREIEARRKEIREIIEAAQAVPPSGYGNIKADLALQKQDAFKGFTPRVQQDVDGIIKNLKSMEPVTAMKEANLIIGRKGNYKHLSNDEAQRILKETDDHIFQRQVDDLSPDDDFASGGIARVGFNKCNMFVNRYFWSDFRCETFKCVLFL